MKKFIEKKVVRCVAILLLPVFVLANFIGCSFLFGGITEVNFNTDRIKVVLGSEISLYQYFDENIEDTDVNILVIPDDENIVSVNYAFHMKALSVGSTELTISESNSKCIVEVVYDNPRSLDIFTYGMQFQPDNDISAIDFVAAPNDYISEDNRIIWDVNGTVRAETGKYFNYRPPAAGVYVIGAEIENSAIRNSVEVVVYPHDEVPFEFSVAVQDERYDFSVVGGGTAEWFVNGKTAETNASSFSFVPSAAGVYNISAKIYGKTALLSSGESEYTITKSGKVIPQNLRFDYDNCYPNLYLTWDTPNVFVQNTPVYYVSISLGETVSEYSSFTHPQRFEGTRFNASGLIDITSEHTLGVSCSWSDGEQGEYARIKTTRVPAFAITYLSKKYLDKNYYITSDEEFFDVYQYSIWMRAEVVEDGGMPYTQIKVYMAYDSKMGAARLSRSAWSRSAQSGYYHLSSPVGRTKRGETLSIKISYDSDNFPTKTTNSNKTPMTLLAPHIANNRDFVSGLPIDGKPLASDLVRTSNELFYIVEKGFRPNIVKGSSAEEMYEYAKNLLGTILDEDMPDLDKIHAIYDWILWRTHYDYDVLAVKKLEESVKYSSYYLESVLTNQYPFSVCDGLSKTFSLLVNMAGIECVRVVGKASGTGSWGEHAWNKVLYGGEWYLVDCTWGDYDIPVDGNIYESASHQYLMLSAGEINVTHRENALGLYPTATRKPLLFLKKENSGFDTDFVLSEKLLIEEEAAAIVDYILSLRPDKEYFYVGDEATLIDYYGVEIIVPQYLSSDAFFALEAAFIERNITNYNMTGVGNGYVYILIRY